VLGREAIPFVSGRWDATLPAALRAAAPTKDAITALLLTFRVGVAMTHALGIDFGTTYSTMAWVDPSTGQAKVLENAEGETKTPSLVYFGEGATLAGAPAREIMLDDEFEAGKVFVMPKRFLGKTGFVRVLPNGRMVTPVEAAAAILGKLKRDAEEFHLHAAVNRVVLTCPATFGPAERTALNAAAEQAGFGETQLIEEPVAAGFAHAENGNDVGHVLLVYDLGGGTFDASVLVREGQGFRLALEPCGIANCGGEDFDRDLYDHVGKASGDAARAFHGDDYNPQFLVACRKAKEMLSQADTATVRRAAKGRVILHIVKRNTFEQLIADRISRTIELSRRLAAEARRRGFAVETAVLIGGSSRIPLVQKLLTEALQLQPHKTAFADFAVALGAARCSRPLPPPLPSDWLVRGIAEELGLGGDPSPEPRQAEQAELPGTSSMLIQDELLRGLAKILFE
jgi:molecular chaperone DnaK (HSP70)